MFRGQTSLATSFFRIDRSFSERIVIGAAFALGFLKDLDVSNLDVHWFAWPIAAYVLIRVLGFATKISDTTNARIDEEELLLRRIVASSTLKKPVRSLADLDLMKRKFTEWHSVVVKAKSAVLFIVLCIAVLAIYELITYMWNIPAPEFGKVHPLAATSSEKSFVDTEDGFRLLTLIVLILTWTAIRYARAWAPIQWLFLCCVLILGFLQAVYAGKLEGA